MKTSQKKIFFFLLVSSIVYLESLSASLEAETKMTIKTQAVESCLGSIARTAIHKLKTEARPISGPFLLGLIA